MSNFHSVPVFLCPILQTSRVVGADSVRYVYKPTTQRRRVHIETATASPRQILPTTTLPNGLPWLCPGCGALTQTVNAQNPGFYSPTRKSVKAFMKEHGKIAVNHTAKEDQAFERVVNSAKASVLHTLGLDDVPENAAVPQALHSTTDIPTPVCNRCHDLIHHNTGVSIVHPTLRSIQDFLSESPYKYNHVYHVLDAADFPLSLIPQLQRHLELTAQRSQNRRSKASRFYHGRNAEMSFVITRSDLLAPNKAQVDKLMPYLVEVLRDALGHAAKNIRLGNVRCVSSKRGWWTKELKEDIWNRGGGGWMVGKVNVGKSNLFENVFPKGRGERISMDSLRQTAGRLPAPDEPLSQTPVSRSFEYASLNRNNGDSSAQSDTRSPPASYSADSAVKSISQEMEDLFDKDSVLPPAALETSYPVMPIVSSLPGTTASPIRLPFGGGKGELIDLPGLSRGNLEDYVSDDHKLDLVMEHRVSPEQYVLKPGYSLLLGGLIRITPKTPDTIFMAYPFVSLHPHVTSTEKAVLAHTQQRESGIPTIAKPGVGDQMALAGAYELHWDVTRQRAGPLTAPAAVGLKPQVLPFVVLSTDILIEGCGWIELVAQVRRKHLEQFDGSESDDPQVYKFPRVEIFSPDGKHIGARRPMNAWLLGGPRSVPRGELTARPRRSMKGVKKRVKAQKRLLQPS